MEASLYNGTYGARVDGDTATTTQRLRRVVFENSTNPPLPDYPLLTSIGSEEVLPPRLGYRGSSFNWRALGIAAAVHIAAFAVLVTVGVVGPAAAHHKRLTTFDITSPPPPPPSQSRPVPDQSEPQLVQSPPVKTQVIAVKPLIQLTTTAPTLTVSPPAPPSPPVAVVASPPSPPAPPAPPAPITPPDFSAAQLGNAGPRYPYEARHSHHQGTVLLKVLVTAEGRAGQVKISHSSGFDELDQAAIKAVSAWRFAPAKQAGKAVDAWVIVPVGFSLA